ncbi:MAG TPA: response regulator transcription factor [Streptosporangiaceae bacterium]|nr:response regulator transcription factor [Streptosporangiaceae bacterium]
MTTSRAAHPVAASRPDDWAKPRVLLIEDEPRISSFVARALTADSYDVDVTATGAEGLRRATATPYQLVLLDLIMPDLDGRVVLERLLAARPTQAVIVVSCLSAVTDKVECLELGAQDYLTKPFAMDELLARVRLRTRSPGDAHARSELISNGALTLDLWRLEADCGQGPVPLTRLEFLLLRELMEHVGQSVSKHQLLASVWGYDFDPGSNVVDVCVRRLRSKLGFDLIKTVRGEGYQLAG